MRISKKGFILGLSLVGVFIFIRIVFYSSQVYRGLHNYSKLNKDDVTTNLKNDFDAANKQHLFKEIVYDLEQANKSGLILNLKNDSDIINKPNFLKEIEYDLEQVNKSGLNTTIWMQAKPSMTLSERQTIIELLRVFKIVCQENNFTYFMSGATLLGSYQYHGFVPWDDDLDFVMSLPERQKFLSTFEKYFATNWTDGAVVQGSVQRLKIFHKTRSIAIIENGHLFRHRWPFLDITFYTENVTHLWEPDGIRILHSRPIYLVFPLHLRPFESVLLNAPNDTYAVLMKFYGKIRCKYPFYSHKLEHILNKKVVAYDCELLKKMYPFVHRKALDGGVLETLMLNDKIIHSVITDEPPYAIAKPYTLELT